MRHRGENLVRIGSGLLAVGMAGCLILFAAEKKLSMAMVAAYAVAVVACAVFATPWPWRGNSRARFYALLGVLWTSVASSALIQDQAMTAVLYGVAAALSFWAALTTSSLHSETHTNHVPQAK
jgi:hypothetical protein